MTSRKSTKSRTGATAPLIVPASRPRNRVAVDPLLKKSGPHGDGRSKRLRATERHGDQEIAAATNRDKTSD